MNVWITRDQRISYNSADIIMWFKAPSLDEDGEWSVTSNRDNSPWIAGEWDVTFFKKRFGFTPKYGSIREYNLVENK